MEVFLERTDDVPERRYQKLLENDSIDHRYGFDRYEESTPRTGWLLNMHPTELVDENKRLVSAIDYYFLEENGSRFKVSFTFQPYFYVLTQGNVLEVTTYLNKRFAGVMSKIETVYKEDLDLPNHLVGLKQKYLKLSFFTVNDLMKVKKELFPIIKKNKEREKNKTVYSEILKSHFKSSEDRNKKPSDQLDGLIDMREYDVPYHVRVSIDHKIFVGTWYSVKVVNKVTEIIKRDDILETPDCIILAFDIETTKLPLKFPDSNVDQIIMISYMVDGQGFLITNRELVSSNVEDFEYTPKPELEGCFTIFNEANEFNLLQKFFDHVMDIKPNVFVTYNGDFFDWPFLESRAAIHGFDMQKEIGFAKGANGAYLSRPASHLDAFCWVKRDSYLPVGSHGLKAVAKAKLRYDPVELDPEDICKLASEQPQILANYSVSDAVATYYLYLKYVHPFIYALCTIIPMEPDEVLRKGSGTLCETLLMVQAFHANIVFPNKHETVLNKMTEDGHLLDSETYVGGHVEALESGVFRSDLPCRFKLCPDTYQLLIDGVQRTLVHAIETEENIPLNEVTNFDSIFDDIVERLKGLKVQPNRIENPIIYHLDVGAMYPNIILTNRLQPSAIVNEVVCAACDFNKPGAKCQRNLPWEWRGEMLPATRSEYQRILQQLETEKFSGLVPNSSQRAFHELPAEEQAEITKKRLMEYCRKAYKKTKVKKNTIIHSTVCQRENGFYVDTVRAFRDRRYEYKGLLKVAKKQVAEATKNGDPTEIKSAKNREVLFDSLQLAHKCILNSFYGYVMRKGARWYSMEMAGITCYTGASIITKARELIEKIGRPLELDTDGIWCILPGSFPENYVVKTSNEKKPKVTISYPGAMLNVLVKDHYTNEQYHELIDAESLQYEIRKENSIFFEVDGPYLAMILPASKEEGKKLKKRYAVFNFDKSLAELKGFEVKRRGELQLIKIFQSSVFEAFLRGDSLETCYEAVAKVADYWLDVLYSKAGNMPDSELFELISENRSMSKKLDEYGEQKSTSISTAKRLAEFLGDQMVKDSGLSCRYIISRKPEGAPVTERAIPMAIFQTDESVKRYYLKRWLKSNAMQDFDIRSILDWNYYIERLGGAIQKIITIPAALQGISNPVPRIQHPDWLHKKILDKNDVFKQKKITSLFKPLAKLPELDPNSINDCDEIADIEDIVSTEAKIPNPVALKRKRDSSGNSGMEMRNWREILGPPIKFGCNREENLAWLNYHKRKWSLQAEERTNKRKRWKGELLPSAATQSKPSSLGQFLKRSQRTLLTCPWEVIEVVESNSPGLFKLWALVGHELHLIKLSVPRKFYVNQRHPKEHSDGDLFRKCNKILPRSHPSFFLYEYSIPEDVYDEYSSELSADLSTPDIEGIYETQVPLMFRVFVEVGCICSINKEYQKELSYREKLESFELRHITCDAEMPSPKSYLRSGVMKYIYLYHHKSGGRSLWALLMPANGKGHVFVLDSVRTNQMPNINSVYQQERASRVKSGFDKDAYLPPQNHVFEVRVETDQKLVCRLLQKILSQYKDDKRGPTAIAVQSSLNFHSLRLQMPILEDYPMLPIHISDPDNLYSVLDWQRVGAKALIRHYLKFPRIIDRTIEQCQYFHIPVGNISADPTMFSTDLFFARLLQRNNFILWCSNTERPDFGGKEYDDNRLLVDFEEMSNIVINKPGAYTTVSVELSLEGLAVNSLIQSHHVHDLEGTMSNVAFDVYPQASLETMLGGHQLSLASYDETALCSGAFRILKSLVTSWLHEVSAYQNVFADHQIIHFYRWIRSSQALLYDPALRRILHNLMKKVFFQLVSEFQKLGSGVIYGDFNKILISTKKKAAFDAKSYCQYIIDKIQSKDLYGSLEITESGYWNYLMWLDHANYGGVLSNIKVGMEETTGPDESSLTPTNDKNEPEIQMNWNIMEYLPQLAGIQMNFNMIIASYIGSVYEKLTDMNNGQSFTLTGSIAMTPVERKSNLTQEAAQVLNENEFETFCQKLVSGEMSQKLFLITQKIKKKSSVVDYDDQELNNRFYKPISNPVLEFVKCICKVLSLDANIEEQIKFLKRNLLKLISVGEFSDESEWHDPTLSYILPEVICEACNHCRDIDLCKDSAKEDNRYVLKCSCSNEYNTQEIEMMLLDVVQRKCMGYVLQDLLCMKCNEVKESNLANHCKCAGKFKNIILEKNVLNDFKIFYVIADNFQMEILKETLDWTFKLSGCKVS